MQVLEERRMLPLGEALRIFEQILQAMEPAGQEGIVHRDIKPSNIVIGNDNRVKIMDSGIAGLPSRSSHPIDPAPGAPHYMSPEQVSGQAVDIRSDIFSLGVMLYEALTGERPFTAESTVALTHKILDVEPIPPRVLNINVPDPLDDLIKKALAKHPADRFQTPTEMWTVLRAVSQSLGGAAGGSNSSTVANQAQLPEEILSVGPEDRGRAGAAMPPPPSGKAATVPRSLPKDAPPPRSVTGAVAERCGNAWQTEANTAAPKNHAAGLMPMPETKSAKPWPVVKTLGSLAVVLLLLVVGGMVLWRLLATPVEQASSPPGASTGLLADNAQNNIAEGELRSSVDSLVDQAKLLWESNPDTARKLLEQAVALDPNHFDAAFQLARFLTFKKDFSAAIQQYQNALRINDQVPDVFFNLGYIYLQQGALDQAIENYEACQALSPPYLDEVLTNLAVCHWKKNNPAQARMLLNQALDFNPNNELARSYLNMLEKSVGSQK